ncbi:guanylate kinase [Malassezia nana]|uniref:Guanylate kinase n=1 Tax=Malassezia nana TaxID=180528 RepID=A0AAF0EQX5_9BASI|nr:guanylate kinase [Malassezia nana]
MSSLRPIVLCGPSGVGKSTLIRRLFDEYPNRFGFSVSHTTRAIRPGEKDGVSYHFVSRDEFLRHVHAGEFLEHAEFGGNLYGTTAKAVQDVSRQGEPRRAILDIDAQGVRLIKAHHASLNPVFVFIAPPTFATLQERLQRRATDTPEAIERRLQMALQELAFAREPHSFDCVIVNDNLDRPRRGRR